MERAIAAKKEGEARSGIDSGTLARSVILRSLAMRKSHKAISNDPKKPTPTPLVVSFSCASPAPGSSLLLPFLGHLLPTEKVHKYRFCVI